uniref:Uncharacterized protein n=1 Tax=Cacopsylla melanoneura TaxID=428564 RepID=A0A8D8Z980_9HEMI
MGRLFLTLLILNSVYTLKIHEYNEDWQRSIKKVKKDKEAMADSALSKVVECKDCLHRMRRETNRTEMEITTRRRPGGGRWSAKKKKAHSVKMKKWYAKQRLLGRTERNVKIRKGQRKYWKRMRDEGRTNETNERFKKIAATMRKRWRKFRLYKAGVRKGKSLKERMEEHWKKQTLLDKRQEKEADKLLKEYWKFHEEKGITPRPRPTTIDPNVKTNSISTEDPDESRYNSFYDIDS